MNLEPRLPPILKRPSKPDLHLQNALPAGRQAGPGKSETRMEQIPTPGTPPQLHEMNAWGFQDQTGDDGSATLTCLDPRDDLHGRVQCRNERGDALSDFNLHPLGQFHIVTLGKGKEGKARVRSFDHGSITVPSRPNPFPLLQ